MVSPPPQPNAVPLQLLSIVMPARDEEGCIARTIEHLHHELAGRGIPHEIVPVDDGSTDDTWRILAETTARISEVRPVRNPGPHGIGYAIRLGFDHMRGDAVVVMMADESDDPREVAGYWELLREGYDAVFGSRFIKGGGVVDYPTHKLVLNRLFNAFIRMLFRHGHNDTTNAFKAYRKSTIDGLRPLIAPHFNLLVELPLKTVIRGYSWSVMPITWRNRRTGVAKLKIREMGSRYLFIVSYCWLEKYFSRGDYLKPAPSAPTSPPSIAPAPDSMN